MHSTDLRSLYGPIKKCHSIQSCLLKPILTVNKVVRVLSNVSQSGFNLLN